MAFHIRIWKFIVSSLTTSQCFSPKSTLAPSNSNSNFLSDRELQFRPRNIFGGGAGGGMRLKGAGMFFLQLTLQAEMPCRSNWNVVQKHNYFPLKGLNQQEIVNSVIQTRNGQFIMSHGCPKFLLYCTTVSK